MTDIKQKQVADARREMHAVLKSIVDTFMMDRFDTRDESKDNLDKFAAIYDKLTELAPPFITSTRCGHLVMDENRDNTILHISKVSFLISKGGVGGQDAFWSFNFSKTGAFGRTTYEADCEVSENGHLDLGTITIESRFAKDVVAREKPFAEWLATQFRFYA